MSDETKVGEDGIIDKIISIDIEGEMRKSFIDYAMSVIVARALPDVRDGLKPVHRRILYAMNELNLDPGKAYKKSARIVGDTMGKYHPHGDSSIYDAMVRMAQDFSMRYPLVDGHGNFGSMDGDGAAAQRYTEARLSRLSVEMLADIEKQTVDFVPNYDGEFTEPVVLPARFPNLLVNGSSGIAVGMATNIPPHNLGEAVDAIVKIIDNHIIEDRDTEIEEILSIIKAPDFPTGATILGTAGVRQAYRTGRGKLIMRAKATIEPISSERDSIVITEVPYQVNKARLIEKIGELVKEKKIDGISDARDESDRQGIKIVIDLKRDTNANVVLNQLYKYSQLQETFGIIMLALVDNEPRVLNLLDMLIHFIKHQKEVVRRRTIFDLDKAAKRAHILEGYLKALDFIDEVIAIIRAARDTGSAKEALIARFEFSDEQAQAIVDMRLRNLTGLESERLREELAELTILITDLKLILESEKRLYEVIREELLIVKTKYADPRRTEIVIDEGEFNPEDLIEDEANVITLTHLDYVKRLPLNTYKLQNRGGKGVIGMQMRDEDLIKSLFVANKLDYILFFTNQGRVYKIRAYEIPEAGRTAKGMAIVNLLSLNPGEKIASVIPFNESVSGEFFVMVTKNAVIKKISLEEFENIKRTGRIVINIRDNDELIAVLKADGSRDIFVTSRHGKGIRFGDEDIRQMGRFAAGVKGMRLSEGDAVVGAGLICEGKKILFVSENGYGKCTEADEFRIQKRNGMGLKIYKITPKTGNVVGVCDVDGSEEIILINSEGVVIRMKVSDISTTGRITQGVKLINLDEGVTVAGIAKIDQDKIVGAEDADEDSVVDVLDEAGQDEDSEA